MLMINLLTIILTHTTYICNHEVSPAYQLHYTNINCLSVFIIVSDTIQGPGFLCHGLHYPSVPTSVWK